MSDRKLLFKSYIDSIYGGDCPATDDEVLDWVVENVNLETIFNDRQDIIDDLSARLEALKGPDGVIRTFTVDPNCDFGDIDEG